MRHKPCLARRITFIFLHNLVTQILCSQEQRTASCIQELLSQTGQVFPRHFCVRQRISGILHRYGSDLPQVAARPELANCWVGTVVGGATGPGVAGLPVKCVIASATVDANCPEASSCTDWNEVVW